MNVDKLERQLQMKLEKCQRVAQTFVWADERLEGVCFKLTAQ